MNVALTLDCRFFRTPDGAVWSQGVHPYSFLSRYLAIFDGVKVVARLRDVDRCESHWHPASGLGVKFMPVPDYLGPWQYLARSLAVRRAICAAVDARDAVIMRVGSQIAGCLEPLLVRRGQPYGLQIVNDPFEIFTPNSVEYLGRPIFRWYLTKQLRRQCKRACAAAYVTDKTLQQRYPCSRFSTTFSDVEITPAALVATPRTFSPDRALGKEYRLVTVCSLTQMYKAPDVSIRALAEGVRAGLNLTLRIVGDGRHRAAMERLTAALGLAGRVFFLGQLPAGQPVREALDAADLFLLPSRSEGLPRALIEAMARSLPCIASNVGGIPELLPSEDLVAPGDTQSLVSKLIEVLGNPGRMNAMAAGNLRRAADFREDLQACRRNSFLREVRRITSCYLAGAAPSGSLTKPEAAWY